MKSSKKSEKPSPTIPRRSRERFSNPVFILWFRTFCSVKLYETCVRWDVRFRNSEKIDLTSKWNDPLDTVIWWGAARREDLYNIPKIALFYVEGRPCDLKPDFGLTNGLRSNGLYIRRVNFGFTFFTLPIRILGSWFNEVEWILASFSLRYLAHMPYFRSPSQNLYEKVYFSTLSLL